MLIHRIRAARAAQRERAPEEFVHRLPWRVWTGTGWEKHAALPEDPSEDPSSSPDPNRDLESALVPPSSSHDGEDEPQPAWVDEQMECAICLEMFVKGDRVRVLPCNHLFHLTEVDEWLISKKKVVRLPDIDVFINMLKIFHQCPICKADITQPRPAHHEQAHPLHHDVSSQHSDDTHSVSNEDRSDIPDHSTHEPTERTPLLAPNPLS